MKSRIRTALVITALLLGSAPAQALRSHAAAGEADSGVSAPVARTGGWLNPGLAGFWSWLESLFEMEHGGILP